ncbi:MAG TPA: hypothetical protein VHN77_09385 [Phycisphaerales bacterium]|nr:hypothetical protein [Phycisphaerales bacterium]
MRPHPRIRKTIKWGGLFFALAMVLFVALNTQRTVNWGWERKAATTYLHLSQGVLIFGNMPLPSDQWDFGLIPGWAFYPVNSAAIRWWPSSSSNPYGSIIAVPLWIPALASSMLSALAWRLDTLATRRAKLGACPTCSYPRTGLAPSAPCPECGAAAPQA